MEGVTILNQTEIMEPTPLAVTVVVILMIIAAITCIAFFYNGLYYGFYYLSCDFRCYIYIFLSYCLGY